MNTKLLSVITAGTAFFTIVAMTGSANAASLSSTASTGYALTDIIDAPLSIQKFDSNLGQLNSVTLDFTSDLLGDASITNKSKTRAINGVIDFNTQVSLSLDDQSLFSLNPEKTYQYTDPPNAIDPITHRSNQPKVVTGLTSTAYQTATFNDYNFLQPFIGTGNLDFLFSAYANSSVTGSGNMTYDINTQAKATVNVTYNYTQKPKKVPEPSATLGIGLIAGLGLLSQRKRSFSKV